MERYVRVGDLVVKHDETVSHRRADFWLWEHWGVREHMAQTRCESLNEYVINVVMAYDMPQLLFNMVSDVDDAPNKKIDVYRSITVRMPRKIMEMVYNRQRALGRNWRQFMLYPSLNEGLIHRHYLEMTGMEYNLPMVRDYGEEE